MKEPISWITVRGNHIPVYEGEDKETAIKKFTANRAENNLKIKEDQINKNKAEADRLNGKELPRTLSLDDIKAESANKSTDVLQLGTKNRFSFKEGTTIRNVYVFAGKGCSKEFRKADKYAKRYGGDANEWQHCSGNAIITNGEKSYNREIHWVQGPDGKMREAFIKERGK